MTKRKNAGKGFGMMFHGLFGSKTDAKKKERKTKGAFIKRTSTPKGTRYLVMSPRTNPIKRKKNNPDQKPYCEMCGRKSGLKVGESIDGRQITMCKLCRAGVKEILRERKSGKNPHELLIMGANPHPTGQEITVPPGSTITIRMNPTEVNPDRYTSMHAQTSGRSYRAPGLIQTERQKRVAGMVRTTRRTATKHKYDWIPTEGIAPGQNPGDDRFMYAALAELYPGKTLGQLSMSELSRVAQHAQKLKHPDRRQNGTAADIREDFTGAPSEWVTSANEPHMPAGDYAQLGELLALYVKPVKGGQVMQIDFSRPRPKIVSDESARQIWFFDGDQDVTDSLAQFGAHDRGAGLFELGEARRIDYKQRKEHVPDPDVDEWRHEFGEETGVRPTVLFDRTKKRLMLEGGQYEIRREGIVN